MIKYDVQKVFGVIKELPSGWKRLVSLVSWNGQEPKIDIREWSEDMTKCSKGLTFSLEEFQELQQIKL